MGATLALYGLLWETDEIKAKGFFFLFLFYSFAPMVHHFIPLGIGKPRRWWRVKALESFKTDFFFFVSFLFLKRLLPFINPFQKRKRNKPPKQSLRKKKLKRWKKQKYLVYLFGIRRFWLTLNPLRLGPPMKNQRRTLEVYHSSNKIFLVYNLTSFKTVLLPHQPKS